MTIKCSCGEILPKTTYGKAMDWLGEHFKHKEGILVDDFEGKKEWA